MPSVRWCGAIYIMVGHVRAHRTSVIPKLQGRGVNPCLTFLIISIIKSHHINRSTFTKPSINRSSFTKSSIINRLSFVEPSINRLGFTKPSINNRLSFVEPSINRLEIRTHHRCQIDYHRLWNACPANLPYSANGMAWLPGIWPADAVNGRLQRKAVVHVDRLQVAN